MVPPTEILLTVFYYLPTELIFMIFENLNQPHTHAIATCSYRRAQWIANKILWRSPTLAGWESIRRFLDSSSDSKRDVRKITITTEATRLSHCAREIIWRRFFGSSNPILPHLRSLKISFNRGDFIRRELCYGSKFTGHVIARNCSQLKQLHILGIKDPTTLTFFDNVLPWHGCFRELYIGHYSVMYLFTLRRLCRKSRRLKITCGRSCSVE